MVRHCVTIQGMALLTVQIDLVLPGIGDVYSMHPYPVIADKENVENVGMHCIEVGTDTIEELAVLSKVIVELT